MNDAKVFEFTGGDLLQCCEVTKLHLPPKGREVISGREIGVEGGREETKLVRCL